MIHRFLHVSEVGRRFVGALCVACVSSAAWAQTQGRPDAGTILDTVREQPAAPRTSPGLQLPPAPRPAMPEGTKVKVQVKSFRIVGNTLFSEAELIKELAEFTGKEQDFEGLQEAARAITLYYRSRGYFLAQAYLPRQELGSGVVEIFVLEGKLGKVDVKAKPDARLRTSIAEGYLRRIELGSIAREADVERPLLLLQDLPGVTVQSTVGPGSTVGEADLLLELGDDGRRITGIAEIENFGNKYAGAIRAGGQIFVNNALGLGDLLTVRGLFAQDKLTEVLGLSYALPVGYWGTKVGVSFSQLRYELGGSLAPSQAAGKADLSSLLVVHPIVRTRHWNLFGQISADVKELEDRVDATSVLEQRRVKGVKLGLFGDARDFVLGGGLNTFSVTMTSAELELLSRSLQQNDPTSFNTAGNFRKYNLDLRRVQRLTEQLHGVARLSYQNASKNLTSAEKASVGGPYGVRAYPVGEGLADRATLLSAELRYTMPGMKVWGGDVTVAGFFDAAHVSRFRDPNPTVDLDPITRLPNSNERTFYGAGVGVRLGRQGDFTLTADFAWRVGSEPPASDVGRSPRVWIHGVKWF